MNNLVLQWLEGKNELFDYMADTAEGRDLSREQQRVLKKEDARRIDLMPRTQRVVKAEQRVLQAGYIVTALACCLTLTAVFLYMTAHITAYGAENPRTGEVAERYIERGVEETGAVNAVAGMILDYRAFDTLGESHVLFTALVVVMLLLRQDSKNMRSYYEDYYRVQLDSYYPTEQDPILRHVGTVLGVCILLFGVYILLCGHLSPGGGFSGGTVLGTGLIILASTLGDATVERFLMERRFRRICFAALSFYSVAKGYVFFTGANGLENHIPKGTPGAILSAGLIHPLDIAVGLVVGCTMFGFYSLFRRGLIGGGNSHV